MVGLKNWTKDNRKQKSSQHSKKNWLTFQKPEKLLLKTNFQNIVAPWEQL